MRDFILYISAKRMLNNYTNTSAIIHGFCNSSFSSHSFIPSLLWPNTQPRRGRRQTNWKCMPHCWGTSSMHAVCKIWRAFGKADAVGIANIIIDCLMSHSSYLASNMSNLGSNPEHNATKSAYEHCFLHCSDAKKALNSAALELKNGSYDSAELSLREAALYQGTCRYEFVSSNETYVPPNVYYDLKVFDILTVAAFRIIEKLWLRVLEGFHLSAHHPWK